MSFRDALLLAVDFAQKMGDQNSANTYKNTA